MNFMRTQFGIIFSFSALALFSILISLFKGSTFIEPSQVLINLWGQGSSLAHTIVYKIRLPHTLSAFVAGGLLALAGTLMQILLRNPLADPYVLGISGGASVVTLGLMCLGFSGLALTGGAWAGSLLAIILVVSLNKNNQILLTGIALASGFSAFISFMLSVSSDHSVHSMLFWLFGDLSDARMPLFEIVILLFGLICSLMIARELNILARGEHEARALGVNTSGLQWKLYGLSSLLTATAVTLVGCVGFVGLIVPHGVRLLIGNDHRMMIPISVLAGGSLMTIADVISRTLFAPQQIPVGIVMSFIGVPIFIFLLRKSI